MKGVTLILAAFLNVAPLATRLLPAVSVLPNSPVAIVLKWAAGALALAGSFHAVSAASAVLASATSINGKVGTRLSYQIKISDGSTRSPESWVVNGQIFGRTGSTTTGLPPGLSLGLSTGIISGIPGAAGTTEVAITASEKPKLGGASLDFTLTFTITGQAASPVITTQPSGGTGLEGGEFNLTIVATGSAPLQYQWRHDGSAIPGANSSTLSLSPVRVSDAGQYTVLVSNSAGTVVSTAVTLAVTQLTTTPVVVTNPSSATLHAGEELSLSVVANGSEPLTYQWKHNSVDLPDANSTTLSLGAVTQETAGDYVVVVSGPEGSAVSETATVIVVPLLIEVGFLSGDTVKLVLQSLPGRNYTVQASDQVTGAAWETLQSTQGTGVPITLIQPRPGQALRFWRYGVAP